MTTFFATLAAALLNLPIYARAAIDHAALQGAIILREEPAR